MKIPERLEPLVEQGIIQEVIRPLMSGKEAQIFVVVAEDEYCVAKVYKDAEHRSFRHRAGYMEGRRIRNSRERRAMEKGSKFGKEKMEAAWQNAEVDALYRLHEAGLRVPRPRLFSDGVLLMDLVLDPEGEPAPRLFDVNFTPEQARELHEILVRQCVWMLCAGMVHGDLSECNVLLAWDGPVIIDLPQATDASHNPNSRTLFVRDVDNFTAFLARFEPELADTKFGPEIWDLYERGQLFADTPLTGRWKGSDKKADTKAVLREVETAARDARMKREAENRPAPKKTDIPRDGLAEARDDRRGPRQARPDDRQRSGGNQHSNERNTRPAERADDRRAPARREERPVGRSERPDQRMNGRSEHANGHDDRRSEGPRRDGPRRPDARESRPAREAARPPERSKPAQTFELDDLDALLVED